MLEMTVILIFIEPFLEEILLMIEVSYLELEARIREPSLKLLRLNTV